jgi:hypothetical protein
MNLGKPHGPLLKRIYEWVVIKDQRPAYRQNPNGFAWRKGFAQWQPISFIAELNPASGIPAPSPPPASLNKTDEIDFKIFGAEMQFVEVELDPGESAMAEAGAMMYKESVVDMQTIFGDG